MNGNTTLRCVAPLPYLQWSGSCVVLITPSFSIFITLIHMLSLLALFLMHCFIVLISFVLPPFETSSLLAPFWISWAWTPRLLTKVFNTATCMRVVVVTFEVSMSVECHVFPIIKTGFLKTLEFAWQGYLADNWIRSISWRVRFMAPASISMRRAGRRR